MSSSIRKSISETKAAPETAKPGFMTWFCLKIDLRNQVLCCEALHLATCGDDGMTNG
jgi:hypothetical protein